LSNLDRIPRNEFVTFLLGWIKKGEQIRVGPTKAENPLLYAISFEADLTKPLTVSPQPPEQG